MLPGICNAISYFLFSENVKYRIRNHQSGSEEMSYKLKNHLSLVTNEGQGGATGNIAVPFMGRTGNSTSPAGLQPHTMRLKPGFDATADRWLPACQSGRKPTEINGQMMINDYRLTIEDCRTTSGQQNPEPVTPARMTRSGGRNLQPGTRNLKIQFSIYQRLSLTAHRGYREGSVIQWAQAESGPACRPLRLPRQKMPYRIFSSWDFFN
jgi:hypothetical protein